MQIKQFEDQVVVALFHRTTRRVELRELAAMELLECIRRKEVDFGIGVEIERSTGFQFDDLFEDPIYAITTKAFPTHVVSPRGCCGKDHSGVLRCKELGW